MSFAESIMVMVSVVDIGTIDGPFLSLGGHSDEA
ncbi:MAG: hypothetical protein Ct9H300mP25_16990 [Acidobacteriota bacterium]|nr:MAG: hypothetical protein Ct9H300mP25_16990 [Acidobacteriota bacterium]